MSLDAASIASIDREIQILSRRRTTQHITHAQARGIIKLFNYYFKERDSTGRIKRLSKSEKARRWRLYKIKVYHQYNRLIKSEFPSEVALVKRYSDPLSFLKYRLKRHRNLKVSDLSPEDQEYYREIGGIDDVEALRQRQANIDSIQKGQAKAFQQSRDRIPMDEEADINVQLALLQDATRQQQQSQSIDNYLRNHNRHTVATTNNNNNNNNHNNNGNNILMDIHSLPPTVENMPELSQVTTTNEPKIDLALQQLHENFTELEREQLEKKKDTANIITQEKTKAFLHVLKEQMSSKPYLLGILPGIKYSDQLLIGFETWIFDNLNKIIQQGYNKNKLVQIFSLLKGQNVETILFLKQWKIQRILFRDDFRIVWNFVRKNLKIIKRNDKEENDDEDDNDSMDEDDEKTMEI